MREIGGGGGKSENEIHCFPITRVAKLSRKPGRADSCHNDLCVIWHGARLCFEGEESAKLLYVLCWLGDHQRMTWSALTQTERRLVVGKTRR